MATELSAPRAIDPAIVERVLITGDLRQLTPAQKVAYYARVCDSLGLNPLTQPFAYIVLNGKEQLYARRECAEQLRRKHNVSTKIVARELVEGCYVVTAGASLPEGRTDESIGAVAIDGLKGEARANAMMKAETKSKRRVTLSICGLGMLDESEVADITVEPASTDPDAWADKPPVQHETLRQARQATSKYYKPTAATTFDWLSKIYAAQTKPDLLAVNRELKAHTAELTKDALEELRAAYSNRAKELDAPATPETPAPPDEPIPF